MISNALEIEKLLLAQVRPYQRRLRNHSRAKIKKLASLVERFGQVTPIIVDQNHEIIDGHAIYQVLGDLGEEYIDVVVARTGSATEVLALRLALNRIPEDSRWNKDELRAEFASLVELSFDMELTGFDMAEIDLILSHEEDQTHIIEDADEIPRRPERPITQLGDVWNLKGHRVACGDALDAGAVAKLLQDECPAAAFWDPPYNVQIDGFVSKKGHREFIQASGEMSDTQFIDFLTNSLKNLAVLRDGAVAFICMDWRHTFHLLSAAKACELEPINLCVWAKTNAGMGSLYRSQHEFIHVFKIGSAPNLNNIELGRHGRNRSNLWTYRGLNSFGSGRDDLLAAHPTVKPVALIADALKDVTRRKDAVLDLFLGSGSTLIAAEETGRRCYGMDLDAGYVDVAIRRWQQLTGIDAIHAETRLTFSEIAEGAGKTTEHLGV